MAPCLGPAPAALSGAVAGNQAAAACFRDNTEEGKGLIQPKCSVGTPCTRAWFGKEQWGSLRGKIVYIGVSQR